MKQITCVEDIYFFLSVNRALKTMHGIGEGGKSKLAKKITKASVERFVRDLGY